MNIADYYHQTFRSDLAGFMGASSVPYFGHSWRYDCGGLERVPGPSRVGFLVCLYFTVLVDQSMHEHSFAALVRSDLFADFLEMAEHLLNTGYKDPAAVLVGAILEEHLRKLCHKHGIPTSEKTKPRKAESLNSDLASSNIYSRLDQKSVTAWQDLRNKAAHGHFSEYADAQVDLMLKGVRDFVSRLPA